MALSAFGGGAAAALVGMHRLHRRSGRAAQSTAMMADFLPESVALGAAAATGSPAGALLAFPIGLQNLPEGFNAYREMVTGRDRGPRAVLWLLAGAALLGPVAGVGGWWLSGADTLVAAVLLAASGAILALVFQDIAPAAHRRGHLAPDLGVVAGFLLGLAGSLV